MKTINIILATLFTLIITSCSSSKVPYTVMDHYFINNTVTDTPPTTITTQEVFNQNFGMAAVMGPNGTPTPVDFDSQFVVAISRPLTDVATEILPVEVTEDNESLVVSYKVATGEKQGYTMHPLLLLRFENKYKKTVLLNEVK